MKFILNKSKAKQVKYTSGILMDIPEGAVSLPDDDNLDKLVDSDPKLSFVSKDEFYKQGKIIPTTQKIKEAKEKKAVIKERGKTTKSVIQQKDKKKSDSKEVESKSDK